MANYAETQSSPPAATILPQRHQDKAVKTPSKDKKQEKTTETEN
jgi:hypothetical protein